MQMESILLDEFIKSRNRKRRRNAIDPNFWEEMDREATDSESARRHANNDKKKKI